MAGAAVAGAEGCAATARGGDGGGLVWCVGVREGHAAVPIIACRVRFAAPGAPALSHPVSPSRSSLGCRVVACPPARLDAMHVLTCSPTSQHAPNGMIRVVGDDLQALCIV